MSALTSSGILRSCFQSRAPVTAFTAWTRLSESDVDVVNITPSFTIGVIC